MVKKTKQRVGSDFRVLPYIVDINTLKKAQKQPKFVKSTDWYGNTTETYKEFLSRGTAREDRMLRVCSGEFNNHYPEKTNEQKCYYLHNDDPYLKLGPMQLEKYLDHPFR